MRSADVANDRQTESGAAGCRAGCAIEAIEDSFALLRWDSGPVVFHFKYDPVRMTSHPHPDRAADAAVRDGVVDEVGDQLVQQQLVAENEARPGILEAEVDVFLPRRRRQVE